MQHLIKTPVHTTEHERFTNYLTTIATPLKIRFQKNVTVNYSRENCATLII